MKTPNETQHANDTPGERLAAELEREFPERRLAEALSELAAATVTTRSGAVESDNRVRLAALQLALAYRIGRPIERQEVRTQTIAADSDILDRLARSPEARRALTELLARAETAAVPALEV